MESTNLNFQIIQGKTFRQRITITSGGVPTNLDDRTFRGRIRAKVKGVIIADLTITKLDQQAYPGVIEISLPILQTSRLPVPTSPVGMRLESKFVHDIDALYQNGTIDPAASGLVFVYPQAY